MKTTQEKQDKFEFIIIPKNALQDNRLTVGPLKVYGYLLFRQGKNDFCYPGHRRMANDLHLNKATVWRSIEQLEKWGWITPLPGKRGRLGSKCYQVNSHPQLNQTEESESGLTAKPIDRIPYSGCTAKPVSGLTAKPVNTESGLTAKPKNKRGFKIKEVKEKETPSSIFQPKNPKPLQVEEDEKRDSNTLICDVCNTPEKLKRNRQTGEWFWGCPNYQTPEHKLPRHIRAIHNTPEFKEWLDRLPDD
jgi:biotin operon repressor